MTEKVKHLYKNNKDFNFLSNKIERTLHAQAAISINPLDQESLVHSAQAALEEYQHEKTKHFHLVKV